MTLNIRVQRSGRFGSRRPSLVDKWIMLMGGWFGVTFNIMLNICVHPA